MKKYFIRLAILMAAFLIANTLTGCGGANEDAYSAEEILAEVDRVYAQAQSYRDSGVVEMIPNDADTGTVMPFVTAFSRPDLFRFEYMLLRNGVEEKSILWRNADEASVWRYYAPWVEEKSSFSLAVAGMTGVSYGAAHTTSRLLMTVVGASPITRIAEVERLNDERIDGNKCFCLRGISGTTTVTLWIDKESFLLRRVERAFSSFTTLLSFNPVLNGPIDDELLALSPPTEMSISGKVADDGYLENARVCLDRNDNRQCDPGEPAGMTDNEGRYLLHGIVPVWLDEAPLIAEIVAGMTIHHEDGGALPIARDYLLSTPPGAHRLANAGSRYFLSPLTTMVHELTVSNPDLTLALAVEEIRAPLGTEKDPLADYIRNQDDKTDGAEYQHLHRVAQAVAIALQQQMEQLSVIADFNAFPYTRATLFAAAAHRVQSFLTVFGEAAATDPFDAERVANYMTYPQTGEVREFLANAILLQMKQMYTSASSYRDTGTVQSHYLLDGTVLDSIEGVFATAFVRPDRFRFEFAESRSGLEVKNILWRNGDEVLSMDGNDDSEVQTHESLAMGIAGMSSISSGVAQIIPQLLVPDEIPLPELTALTEVYQLDTDEIDGILFFRVGGILPHSSFDNAVTLWIDKGSYLIYRFEIESRVPPYTINLNVNYSPMTNEFIDENLLLFNPTE